MMMGVFEENLGRRVWEASLACIFLFLVVLVGCLLKYESKGENVGTNWHVDSDGLQLHPGADPDIWTREGQAVMATCLGC